MRYSCIAPCDYKQTVLCNIKRFSVPVNISLADKGTILACGSGRANIDMLVEEVVPLMFGRHVVCFRYGKKPLGRECGRTSNWSRHKTSTGYVSVRQSAQGNRQVEDGRIRHGHVRRGP